MSNESGFAAKYLEETLVNFTNIIGKLRNGEYITKHHHAQFKEMRDNHDAYTIIFKMLGEDLIYHQAGFYRILEDENANMSDRSKLFILMALCIIEQIGDTGLDPIQVIDAQTVLSEDFFDKLILDQRKHLSILNVHQNNDFYKSLNSMAKYGLLAASEETFNPGFKLYPSFHIYIDACKKIQQTKETNENKESGEIE